MASAKLKILQRQLNISPGEKPPVKPDHGHGLGIAIEKLIEDMVQERVKEALEKQPVKQPAHVQRLMQSFNAPAPSLPPVPAPRTPVPVIGATIQRDGAGLARAIVINGQRFLAQRDAAGLLIGVVAESQASETLYNGRMGKPAPLNDPKSSAGPVRSDDPYIYNPGTPRN